MGSVVTPDKILKELAALWTSTAKESETSTGVLRACSLTLLVLAEEGEDTQSLGETIAALMPEHPARAIVVRLRGAGARALTERVYSQCWMPFGQRRQICCEQVEITASDAALADLPLVVLPLAVPDLPLILWCRSPRLPEMREFWRIAAMADKVILDSAASPDPLAALLCFEAMAASGVLLGDLSWARLTRWRAMLSQLFENQQNLSRLGAVTRVGVEWTGEHFVPALYLGAWVRDSLAVAGIDPAFDLSETPECDSLRLRLVGEGFEASIERQQDRMLVTLDGVTQCTNLPLPTDYLLMREELQIVRHDTVFEKTLASAARLAYPTEK